MADKSSDEDFYLLTLAAVAKRKAVAGLKKSASISVWIRAKETVLRKFGTKISDHTVEQILRTGTAKIDAAYLACIRDVASAYVEELFAVLRSYEYDPATVQLIVAGGGGQLIKHAAFCPQKIRRPMGSVFDTGKEFL